MNGHDVGGNERAGMLAANAWAQSMLVLFAALGRSVGASTGRISFPDRLANGGGVPIVLFVSIVVHRIVANVIAFLGPDGVERVASRGVVPA